MPAGPAVEDWWRASLPRTAFGWAGADVKRIPKGTLSLWAAGDATVIGCQATPQENNKRPRDRRPGFMEIEEASGVSPRRTARAGGRKSIRIPRRPARRGRDLAGYIVSGVKLVRQQSAGHLRPRRVSGGSSERDLCGGNRGKPSQTTP